MSCSVQSVLQWKKKKGGNRGGLDIALKAQRHCGGGGGRGGGGVGKFGCRYLLW